ncbi:hypothetical protein D0N36_18020 [Hymenobacter lapidiphilus]|uniref:hypothetical protein n=1 Tax=Hymenobacter sp. CCM 8763 TaxID=2303334 RepID=UPI000E345336|nr:hypothetical protein [Hymenobacter sp. CCM 8763]RFP63704.1 hypothetical protein D0N36_18020 [Hymenobacter sp. CCM 8763]
MKFLPALFITSICLAACHKKDAAPTIDFGPNDGITLRDASGRLQGTSDPTDWTLDENWNQQEQDLFKDLGLNLNATAVGTFSRLVAYPNPITSGQAVFHFVSPAAVECKLVIVNAKYQVVQPVLTAPAVLDGAFHYDVRNSNFEQGKRYRLYYIFKNGNTFIAKGHGDIKIGL